MPFAQLVAFDRPLASATLRHHSGRLSTEAEVAAQTQEAYRRGVDAARAAADQQMVEFRADIAQMSDGILSKFSAMESLFVSQLRAELPGLAVEIARRLLAGFEPPPDLVAKLCTEALEELFPEREDLELVVCPRDAALLDSIHDEWKSRFPGLRIRGDAALKPGDCQVRSRFGLTDARLSTKLTALSHSLSPT